MQQRDDRQRQGPAYARRAHPFGRFRLHVDLRELHPRQLGDARAHGLDVRHQLGRLRHDGRVDVADGPAQRAHALRHLGQQHARIGALEARIRVGKMAANVAQARRAQQRVDDGVQQRIRI